MLKIDNIQNVILGVPPPIGIPDGMPDILTNELKNLEKWADINIEDAKKDTIQFWLLKIPAIVTSACAGIFAHFELTDVSVISGAIASICVVVDGIHPRGMLKNTHTRASHDIRILSNKMVRDWKTSSMTIR